MNSLDFNQVYENYDMQFPYALLIFLEEAIDKVNNIFK